MVNTNEPVAAKWNDENAVANWNPQHCLLVIKRKTYHADMLQAVLSYLKLIATIESILPERRSEEFYGIRA